MLFSFFFFNDTATTEIYTLSLHDALPISHLRVVQTAERGEQPDDRRRPPRPGVEPRREVRREGRSEEHTSELQSRRDLVCRLLLEKKKKEQLARRRTTWRPTVRTSQRFAA